MLAALLAIAIPLCLAPSALAAPTTGQISGTVTSSSGKAPIEGIEVCASSLGAEAEECALTGPTGAYTISGLQAGQYYVGFYPPFESKLNFTSQYYNKASSRSTAQAVLVTAGSPTTGVDAELEAGAQISGVVTSKNGKIPLKGISVCAFPTSESLESGGCTKTEANGSYSIPGLRTGEYDVHFSTPFESGLNYVAQYYNAKQRLSEAQPVAVTAPNAHEEINAEMEEGASITGRVTDASTGVGLAGALVCAEVSGLPGGCAITHAGGEYTIIGLGSGSYTVEFSDGREYLIQYYNGKAAHAEAQPVTVTAPGAEAGIDAALQRAGTPPANTTPPSISGTPAVGATLLCANGRWTGKPAPAFTQLWLRDGAPIPGALGSSYVVQGADAGHSISCMVIAKNVKGEKSATSASVAIPSPPPPPPPPTPVVTSRGSKIVLSGKTAKVRLRCSGAPCSGSVELTVQVQVRPRHGRKTRKQTVVLARGTYSLAAGQSATVTLRLTAAGRKRLAHAKHHPVAAKLTLLVQGGRTATTMVRVG